MSRQLEQKQEERAAQRRLQLEKALEFELAGSIEASGYTFLGFTVRYRVDDAFIVLKATTGDKSYVSFIGSDTIANGLLKCVREAKQDTLRWKEDKYQKSNN